MEQQSNAPSTVLTAGSAADAQQDFKVALVLLAVAVALLVHTLGFPMSGSYGGVDNQWFVSPALFPLLVCGLLVICSGMLLYKATRKQGFRGFGELRGWLGDWRNERIKDRWYVIGLLLVYVYVYIPSTDFYLASVVFLLSLTSRFYYPMVNGLSRSSTLHLVLALCLIAVKLNVNVSEDTHWLSINYDEDAIRYSDLSMLMALMCLLTLSVCFPQNKDRKRAVIQVLVVLLVPLLLVCTFNFLLYVPMPVEYGTVSDFLNYLVYDVLAFQ
ncbi:tripartite tricarboxylate transporter TctB family protein [Alteromonas aestuariivivens]|uniref:Tripartite tricarboxylate transporter TctB family protein n=1 Tax=Alteromonas aestuariivivens TaxID=1938339 RepID=A0A3D8MEF9_9ALTE|nr:tripartite tricarboxylate transporter TctB family protein [Alteromonas aestuariivivens]RDV29143.1 tripartite tricarboxylate transporter TctB family protein [Alteromonas aestuariivivens]